MTDTTPTRVRDHPAHPNPADEFADEPTRLDRTPQWREWTIACLDRLCLNCRCGQSLAELSEEARDD